MNTLSAQYRPIAFLRLRDSQRSIVIATRIVQQVLRVPLLRRFQSFFGYSDSIYDHGDARHFLRDVFRGVTL
jgi:hypothetical protein